MTRLTKRVNGVCVYIGETCLYPDTGELADYEDTGLEPEAIIAVFDIIIRGVKSGGKR